MSKKDIIAKTYNNYTQTGVKPTYYYLMTIMSCKKNKHLWNSLLKANSGSIIFCADENLSTDYIFQDRTLYLQCGDGYEHLPEKIICMIDAVLDIFNNITHIIKIDDHDTKPCEDILATLNGIKHVVDYGGQKINHSCDGNRKWHLGRCSKDSNWNSTEYTGVYTPWIDGGCGYILSLKAMKCINRKYGLKEINVIRNTHIYEDVMVALILLEYDIHPVKIESIIEGDK